jgi:hypothetical protein
MGSPRDKTLAGETEETTVRLKKQRLKTVQAVQVVPAVDGDRLGIDLGINRS